MSEQTPERVELKPYRQTWLSPELMHSAPSASLFVINGAQWVQLEHPKGGPLTCVKNRTGKTASAVVRVDGKWCFEFAAISTELPMSEERETRMAERARFERFFAQRKNKGKRFRESMFDRLEDGTYAEDSVQRHWWTWQNAVGLAAGSGKHE